MRTQVQYGLQGAFKVDLFSGDTQMESTDWFSNFITHTGLYYPSVYAFADCFRYLSIGSGGNIPNSGYSAGFTTPTTGLAIPITNFQVNGDTYLTQKGTYMGWEAYDVGQGGQDSPCGTRLTDQGLCLFRAWTIPSGNINRTIGEQFGLQISEFMVSPSSGNDPTGMWAFSRVCRPLSIPNGWRAIVSYQLRIKLTATGTGVNVSPMTGGTFATGNADVTNDLDLVSGWNQLSGYFRQVYPGLACIDANGATYIPKYGAILEPSIKDLSNFAFYLSPDNAAFDVNGLKGGVQDSESRAYSSDGLMQSYYFHTVPLTYGGDDNFINMSYEEKQALYTTPLESKTFVNFPATTDFPLNAVAIPTNIRLGKENTNISTPSVYNYSLPISDDVGSNFHYQSAQDASTHEISFATPGTYGLDNSKVNFGQKAVFSTRVYKLPLYNGIGATGRAKRITRRTMFAPVSSMGTNSRFGSLVAAYTPDSTAKLPQKTFYPVIDALFYDSSGRSMMRHYRTISGFGLSERGTGVCAGFISIYQIGDGSGKQPISIQRYYRRQLLMGGITGGVPIDPNGFFTNNPQFALTNGAYNDVAGNMLVASGGGSGVGAVLGVCGWDFTGYAPDIGLVDHTINNQSTLNMPVTGAPLYWPDVKSTSQLSFVLSGVKYAKNGIVYQDNGESIATLKASGFCRPIFSFIDHRENIGSTGFRLLPNHGLPNNSGIDVYPQTNGGYYPALSMDNGLDLYLDIMWSAPCGGALGCFPTGETIIWK